MSKRLQVIKRCIFDTQGSTITFTDKRLSSADQLLSPSTSQSSSRQILDPAANFDSSMVPADSTYHKS